MSWRLNEAGERAFASDLIELSGKLLIFQHQFDDGDWIAVAAI